MKATLSQLWHVVATPQVHHVDAPPGCSGRAALSAPPRYASSGHPSPRGRRHRSRAYACARPRLLLDHAAVPPHAVRFVEAAAAVGQWGILWSRRFSFTALPAIIPSLPSARSGCCCGGTYLLSRHSRTPCVHIMRARGRKVAGPCAVCEQASARFWHGISPQNSPFRRQP